ncbi:hypothetical protein [Pseudanabaena sp. PCC 6802]|uniref:hypothetical protein n=1 Tax=Pseudanabaena sp. PCC 6802 TaxID=118173 RepID=UPI00034A9688|nr:hypothetical protein [Pseudanabaena sp. PCC 6802]
MSHQISKLLPGLLCTSLLWLGLVMPAQIGTAIAQPPPPKKVLPAQVANAVRQDLAKKTKIAPGLFKVKDSSPQTWQDGCLGLAKPDEFCTMALVPGWQVVMSHGNQTWTYRTDSSGRAVRLEK